MPNNDDWIDLSGVLGIQRALLSAGRTVPPEFTAVSDAVSNANNNILPTLAYQQEVLDIVNRENGRLVNRKKAIDNAYNGQARMVSLTDSVTAKNQAYNYMLFVVVLIIFSYLGIKMLKSLDIVPSIVLEILNIIIISVGLIYCIYLYIDIKRRYNMDFNQVVLQEPPAKSQDQINKDMEANMKSGNLLGVAGSQGSCQPDHTYSKNYKICVPNAPPVQYNNGVLTENQYPNTARYFAKADGTFEWRDANAQKGTDAGGCATSTVSADIAKGITNYDYDLLGCKAPETFSNMILGNSSANAEAFTASDFNNYGKYN